MKESNKFILAGILGAVAYAVCFVLNEIIFSILNPSVFTGMRRSVVITVNVAVVFILTFVSVFAAVLVYYKAVLKKMFR